MPLRTEDEHVIARLTNVNAAGEGSNLPPRQIGEERVPSVTNFQIIRVSALNTGYQFTLLWDDVPELLARNVDRYEIYVIGSTFGNTQPVSIGSARSSPFTTIIASESSNIVTFLCQTILKNGMASNVALAPTCTYAIVATS